jgi:hypothetical protein
MYRQIPMLVKFISQQLPLDMRTRVAQVDILVGAGNVLNQICNGKETHITTNAFFPLVLGGFRDSDTEATFKLYSLFTREE